MGPDIGYQRLQVFVDHVTLQNYLILSFFVLGLWLQMPNTNVWIWNHLAAPNKYRAWTESQKYTVSLRFSALGVIVSVLSFQASIHKQTNAVLCVCSYGTQFSFIWYENIRWASASDFYIFTNTIKIMHNFILWNLWYKSTPEAKFYI